MLISNVESTQKLLKVPSPNGSRNTSVISRTPNNRPSIIISSLAKSKTVGEDTCGEPKPKHNEAVSTSSNYLSQMPIETHQAIDLNDPRSFLQNANIICVNCSTLLDDFNAFEKHECGIGLVDGQEIKQIVQTAEEKGNFLNICLICFFSEMFQIN